MSTSAIRIADIKTPGPGEFVEVAEGILWARVPLPTRLNHVNVYLLEDSAGWTVIDTGMVDERGIAAWRSILAGALRGRPVTRLICTHFHRDHVGMATWLREQFAFTFHMSLSEYLLTRVYSEAVSPESFAQEVDFFLAHGLDPANADAGARVRTSGRAEARVPSRFERLRAGDSLRIGARHWRVLTGGGHSVEQVMLYSAADRLFLAADQVLPDISPNISVGSIWPNANPLGDFLQSLGALSAEVDDDVMVLPGHRAPFFGLHERISELIGHHEARCAAVMQACAGASLSAAELIPVIFGRSFGPDVVAPAMGEAIAHANYLVGEGRLAIAMRDGILTYRAAR